MLLNQQLVQQFVAHAISYGDYEQADAMYIQNQLLRILNATGIDTVNEIQLSENATANMIAQYWIEQAINEQRLEDTIYIKEIVEAQILDLITPRPSVVNRKFKEAYKQSPEAATNYFYEITKRNHYVKEDAIANNINYEVQTEYGAIEITINLSKPEKDAKQIAKAKAEPTKNYPKCALCIENEGYEGSVTQAARTNHRIIHLDLGGKSWGFQYSPYAYFQEHSIVLSEQHVPMEINQQTFINLLDFIEQFPHYFIGSNADIPLVGGSILSHNHYQSGKHIFPMDNAAEIERFTMEGFTSVSASTLNWPMSVIRLKCEDRDELIKAATHVMNVWNQYTDETIDVRAFGKDGERHHTVTPISRYRQGQYELDIVLRDNQTSAQFPDGIFHPHADVQHIKKENIGLIEVMGTAILPGRLKEELQQVKAYLLGDNQLDLGVHQQWADQMKQTYNINKQHIDEIINKEVGYKFKRVLEDAGVFKNTESGQQAFNRFINHL
ncbi:UDP-glucose--hexose-1-phosphate uridylyltransferase [Staphylococcus edaphicus]|uniref:Galactose-1-phosphate uridylyltransferase n=1 Tax=Staphylococcus edaphicus TaxID=1955013 RepID=A0A2C6WQ30_9STAP|nr:UDP-glucose--hexose-1-phosphate uridylyltransferase [Staphylococcus edaphicus]PHK50243.1 UDP-glucose--hexose-1-phosphate uridylyltransferase [Staphylococcus edaphicus]UQW82159.1 UDP-glucose--hexose-1-phosphate uridylyltransferase [Staphylococcus edaphicus]